MIDFRKKKTLRRFMYSPWTLAALAIVVFLMAKGALNVNAKRQTSGEALGRAQLELGKLSERQKNLGTAVAYLSTPQGVETEIRTKFRVAKEGESVAVILEDAVATTSPNNAASKRGFWYRLSHLFGSE
ncbi:MAG: protein of unknown function with transrane region [Candidatus Taylorbacteria bacterium]|nr:protein of unknown function with transrane region [Candidatus Taylorbacteria bacterium]